MIVDKSRKFLVFAIFGLTSAASSILFGKLSDSRLSRSNVFLVGALAHAVIYGLLLSVWQPPLSQDRLAIFIVLVIGLGLGDSVLGGQLCSTIAVFYGHTRPADAFACLKVFQAVSTALVYFVQVYLPIRTLVVCLIIALSLAMITLIYEHFQGISLDTGKTMTQIREMEKATTEIEIENTQPLTILAHPV